MSKHFYIEQSKSNAEQNVNEQIVTKLYNIIDTDNRLGDFLDPTSAFYGHISIPYTYQKYIDAIYEKFPSATYLEITASGTYVYFEDKKVEQILKEHYANGLDGILVTLQVDANNGFYDNNSHIFQSNTKIETFDELNQFQYIKKIGTCDFKNCTNLRSINLTNITSIGSQAFEGDTSLAIDINLPNCITLSERCFRETAISSITNIGNIIEIPSYCFYHCTSLETIAENALSNITTIGNNAFAECTLLENVSELQSLRTINSTAFSGCTSLQSFDFNENITTIGNNAFNGDTLLTIDDLNLPNLTSLGGSAFRNTRIKKISNLGNVIFNTTWNDGYVFANCTLLTTVALPNNITNIPGSIFEGCTNLTTINLPQSITYIGGQAFYGCTNLVIDEINLPNLTTIGSRAFSNTAIKKIINLGSITSVPHFMCSSCKSLTYADLTGITSLGDTSFGGCTALTTVISPDLTTIDINEFRGCSSLTSIDLQKCKYLPTYAFQGCSSLNNIDLSNVESIGNFCFSGANNNMSIKKTDDGYIDLTKLKTLGKNSFEWLYSNAPEPYPIIDLGGNITSLDTDSFRGTKASIICRNTEVPATTSIRPFFVSPSSKIYVLDNMVDAFKEVWSGEAQYIHPLSEIEP